MAVVQQPHNKAKIHTQKQRRCKDAATKTRYQIVRLYGEGYREEEIEQIKEDLAEHHDEYAKEEAAELKAADSDKK